MVLQGGDEQDISTYPQLSLNGNNNISIKYSGADVSDSEGIYIVNYYIKIYLSLSKLDYFFLIRFYTMCVCCFNRRKLINTITLFFAICLVLFWGWLSYFGTINGIIFYLWSGIFSLIVIAQFWSFANDIYSAEQGKRLFILLAFGAATGGVFGPMLASFILDIVGLYNLLLVSAVSLLLSLVRMNYVESRTYVFEEDCHKTAGEGIEQKEVSHTGPLALLFKS